MIVTPTAIAGVAVVDIERRADHRGFFARSFCTEEMAKHGLPLPVAQCNIGFTARRGTLRGLHYQSGAHAEAKLIRCTAGAIYDVAVDLRPKSPTFRRWFAIELTAESRRMLYLSEGVAHGYQTLADDAEITYFASRPYAAAACRGVRYNDPAIAISWPLQVSTISEADRDWPDFTC